MPRTDAFDRWYQDALGAELDRLEKKRKTTLFCVSAVATVVWGLLLVGLVRLHVHWLPWLTVWAPIFGVIPTMFAYYHLVKDFKRDYKDTVVRRLVTHLDPSLQFQAGGSLKQDAWIASHLFPVQHSSYSGEDLVWGEIKGTPFGVCELKVDTGAGDSRSTIFQGFFFEIGLTHPVAARVVVVPRVTDNKLFGLKLVKAFERNQDPEVTVDDASGFAGYYRVHCADPAVVEEALQPELRAHLLQVRGKKGRELYFSLVEDKAYLAISHTDDMFEGSIFATVHDPRRIRSYLGALKLITSIPATLSLSRDGAEVGA